MTKLCTASDVVLYHWLHVTDLQTKVRIVPKSVFLHIERVLCIGGSDISRLPALHKTLTSI